MPNLFISIVIPLKRLHSPLSADFELARSGAPTINVLWKIAATLYATSERAALLRRLRVEHIDLDSEAMQVSRKIFETMRDEVQAHGLRFMLVFLPEPHDVRRIRHDPRNWRQVMDRLCAGLECIDLAPALARVPAEEIDRGHDGTHYGPTMNRLVATELEREGRLRQP